MGTVGFFLKKGCKFINKFKICCKFFLRLLGKIKGTSFFLGGFLVICIFRGFTFIGFGMQLYGIFVLFKSFIPFLYESACSMPFVGKYISKAYFKYIFFYFFEIIGNISVLKKMIEKLSKRKPPV